LFFHSHAQCHYNAKLFEAQKQVQEHNGRRGINQQRKINRDIQEVDKHDSLPRYGAQSGEVSAVFENNCHE
jgi:hypothetical protein